MSTCCNEKVLLETTIKTGESRKTVESVIKHQSRFIHSKIREGSFESIRVPYFGIFKAKLRSVQMLNFMQTLPKAVGGVS
jgi:hypothetical protein